MNKLQKKGQDVITYCANIGQDRLLVQAAGGNASWKDNNILWIKASGTWLADSLNKDIFIPVDLEKALHAVADQDFNPVIKSLEGEMRPSIETMLHALMPQRIVLHLHPVDVVAQLIKPNHLQLLHQKFNGVINWVNVRYQKPGGNLAKDVFQALNGKTDINLVFLENHGLIIGGNTVEEIDFILNFTINNLRLQSKPGQHLFEKNASAVKWLNCFPGYQFCIDTHLNSLSLNPALYDMLQKYWTICPDHVVFLGPQAACIDEIQNHVEIGRINSDKPPFIFVKQCGVLQEKSTTPTQVAQLQFYLDVMERLSPDDNITTLSDNEVSDLIDWDAEKYRIKLSQRIN